MSSRRSHYELAFEAYLNGRGTPYVAVEDVRHFTRKDTGLKAFDYIVYPSGIRPCLVDVKGRKSGGAGTLEECRQKNWVTRSDVTGLLTWQDVFGAEYLAAFAFAYWMSGVDGGGGGMDRESTAPFPFAGRLYRFWVVTAAEYAQNQRKLSARWDTVAVPRETFRRISRPLEACWPSAPC